MRVTRKIRKGRKTRKIRRRLHGGSEAIIAQCQCSDECKNPVNKGEVFCSVHMNGCPIKGALSGWEPEYDPNRYNGDKSVQHSHNCFAYAMNVQDNEKIDNCRKRKDCHFHVPGKTKDHPEFSGQMGKTCGDVIGRTMADVPRGYLTDFATVCEPGFSKIAVVVDKINDLHYYRQDKPNQEQLQNLANIFGSKNIEWLKNIGWWSHKPGARQVTNKDALGAYIYRPDLASRNYPAEYVGDSGLNYSSFCSYMCVPRDRPIQIAGRRRRH